MAEVGVRELKNRASEIIREVREERTEYVVTYRGEPVARLVPIVKGGDAEQVWQELDELSEEIGARWNADESAVEILSAMRR